MEVPVPRFSVTGPPNPRSSRVCAQSRQSAVCYHDYPLAYHRLFAHHHVAWLRNLLVFDIHKQPDRDGSGKRRLLRPQWRPHTAIQLHAHASRLPRRYPASQPVGRQIDVFGIDDAGNAVIASTQKHRRLVSGDHRGCEDRAIGSTRCLTLPARYCLPFRVVNLIPMQFRHGSHLSFSSRRRDVKVVKVVICSFPLNHSRARTF